MSNSKVDKKNASPKAETWKSFLKKKETIYAVRKVIGFLMAIPVLTYFLLRPVWTWFVDNPNYIFSYVVIGIASSILGTKEEWEDDAGRKWMNRIVVSIVLLFVISLIWPNSFAGQFVTRHNSSVQAVLSQPDNAMTLSATSTQQQFSCGVVSPGDKIVIWVERGSCDLEVVHYFRRHIDHDVSVPINRAGQALIKVSPGSQVKYKIVSNA